MASDTESIPSAVATTLPLRYPVIISTIPIARRVTTDIFAILLPAIIPSRTNLDEEEEEDDGDGDGDEGGGKVVAELLEEEEEEEEEVLFSLLLLVAAAALAVVAVSLSVPGVEDEDESKEEDSFDELSNFIILVYNNDCLYLKCIFELRYNKYQLIMLSTSI